MATLVKQKDWYYAQFYDRDRRPQRKQIPLRTRTHKTALKLLIALEDEVARGERDPWARAEDAEPAVTYRTLGEAVEAFVRAKAHLRPASVFSYRTILRLFARDAGGSFEVERVRTKHVAGFLERAQIRDVTRKTYLRHLRVFFRWLVAAGTLKGDPTTAVKLRRVPDRFPRFLSPDYLDRLLGAIRRGGRDRWMLPVVEATAYLGLRLGEACALRWDHVDLERGRLTVANTDTFTSKSGRERTIPIPARPLAILRELQDEGRDDGPVFVSGRGNPIYPNLLSRRFCEYRRLAGLVDGVSFHTLRHTAASWLMMNGASIEAVRLYLGHSSVTVTQKYAHLSDDAYAQQVVAALHDVSPRRKRQAPVSSS